MTKSLNTQLSQQDGPAHRSTSRPRAWLVALLGFGAADLLILNLWAVPNLIIPDTTTDMRAAQSGEAQGPSEAQPEQQPTAADTPQPAASQVAQGAVAAADTPAKDVAPAEPGAREGVNAEAAAREGANAAPVAREGANAEPGAREGAKAEGSQAEPAGDQAAQVEAPARQPTRAEARKLREALRQPPPEPEHVQLAAAPREAPQPQAAAPQLAAVTPQPGAAAQQLSAATPQAEPPSVPADPPTGFSADAYAPPDTGAAPPFAIRAAQRAVRFALLDRLAAGGTGPFDGLTEEAKPFTQIYFSMGNFMLGPNGKQVLERLLPKLTSDERPILIVGSADPSGSEQVNEKLSDARAQAVAEWLLVHGVDAGRIQTRAIGHEGAVGSTLDRRVDIWLGGSR